MEFNKLKKMTPLLPKSMSSNTFGRKVNKEQSTPSRIDKSTPLRELHEVNRTLSRTMNKLDQVVLKAHKGYVASEFAGEDLLNLKTALQSIDDCLDSWIRLLESTSVPRTSTPKTPILRSFSESSKGKVSRTTSSKIPIISPSRHAPTSQWSFLRSPTTAVPLPLPPLAGNPSLTTGSIGGQILDELFVDEVDKSVLSSDFSLDTDIDLNLSTSKSKSDLTSFQIIVPSPLSCLKKTTKKIKPEIKQHGVEVIQKIKAETDIKPYASQRLDENESTPPCPSDLVKKYPESFKKWNTVQYGADSSPLDRTPSMGDSPPQTCKPIRMLGSRDSGISQGRSSESSVRIPSPFLTPGLHLKRCPNSEGISPLISPLISPPNLFSFWPNSAAQEKKILTPKRALETPQDLNFNILKEMENMNLLEEEIGEKTPNFTAKCSSSVCEESVVSDEKENNGTISSQIDFETESLRRLKLGIDKIENKLDLKIFPLMFRRGEGAEQLQNVFNLFMLPGVEENAEFPHFSQEEVCKKFPELGYELTGLLLDLLTSRGLLFRKIVDRQYRWYRK